MRRLPNLLSTLAVLGVCVLTSNLKHVWAQETPLDVTVAADGSGTYKTVQEAIDSAPNGGTQRFVIRIQPGTYKEKLLVPRSKGPISFLGTNALTTILTFDDYAGRADADGKALGTAGSYSIRIDANDFEAANITFENSHPVGGGTGNQALALSFNGDRGVFRNCRFLGRQDTLYLGQGRQYLADCYIAGQVDFIFGAATAWFEKCQLHCVAKGIAITAASTPQEQPFGFVFSNCTITAEPGADWKTHLGRPWRPYASVMYLNTEMPAIIEPEGWDNWGKPENEKTARYVESNSKTPDGEPVDVSRRVPWVKNLTSIEAAYTVEKVFGDWNPLARN